MSKLKTYQKKRDFSASREPKGTVAQRQGKTLHFVVQRHHASRLHYDFRIELQGVLKSWAVPKGPSMNPKDKRLAVQVEDHPLDYKDFEGIIPKGNYGAGTVSIFDAGTYSFEEHDTVSGFSKALQSGSAKIHLKGSILKGEFALVRMKGPEEHTWLLIKHKDEYAIQKTFDAEDHVSELVKKQGKEFKELTEGDSAKKNVREKKGKEAWNPTPMYARLEEQIPKAEGWQYEKKIDGFRVLVLKQGKRIQLLSRNGKPLHKKFPSLVTIWEEAKPDFCVDGELVVEDKLGVSHFQLLQQGEPLTKDMHLQYYPFDLLMLDQQKTHQLSLVDRQELLKLLMKKISSPLLGKLHVLSGTPDKLLQTVAEKEWEGIIAKRKDSTYQEGKRTGDWRKIKIRRAQEAVICGFTSPKGSRQGFGALILGLYEQDTLRYIGNCGTGFDDQLLVDLHQRLRKMGRKTKPFSKETVVANESSAQWTTPRLVCEVYYSEWTQQNHLRHPVFKGLRPDKSADEVVVEKSGGKEKERTIRLGSKSLLVTNLDKLYWPDEGITKGEIIAYYESVGDYMLPYLKDKPISMHRFPNGVQKPGFFQKDVDPESGPKWIKTVPVFSESTEKNVDYIVCNNLATLLYLANLGSIEINPWLARYRKIEYPDFAVLDLDPNGVNFKEVLKVARTLRALLEETKIAGFVKTSGSTGLHVYFNLERRYDFTQARDFIELLAEILHQRHPDQTSLVRDPKKRKGKIYLDFLQNRRGQTIVSPYSVRPKPMATVSAPLHWKELDDQLSISDFTINNMVTRIRAKDPWEKIWDSKLNLKEILSRF